jgi:hypothetical protein
MAAEFPRPAGGPWTDTAAPDISMIEAYTRARQSIAQTIRLH